MNKIRMVRVLPTRRAWYLVPATRVEATRAEDARMKVPRASSPIPRIGLMPLASVVEPRLTESFNREKTSLSVSPARMPPEIWRNRYGTTKPTLSCFADAAASVIAGLISEPENLPKLRMTRATVPPKTSATKAIASNLGIENNDVEMTDAGPSTTRM